MLTCTVSQFPNSVYSALDYRELTTLNHCQRTVTAKTQVLAINGQLLSVPCSGHESTVKKKNSKFVVALFEGNREKYCVQQRVSLLGKVPTKSVSTKAKSINHPKSP